MNNQPQYYPIGEKISVVYPDEIFINHAIITMQVMIASHGDIHDPKSRAKIVAKVRVMPLKEIGAMQAKDYTLTINLETKQFTYKNMKFRAVNHDEMFGIAEQLIRDHFKD